MRGDSKVTFSPGNYPMTTTPEAEWRVVEDPEEGKRVSVGKRLVHALEELKKDPLVQEAGLLDEEIMALVLYTGCFFTFFFTLGTGPRRSLRLKLSETRVYGPQVRARLGATAYV